MTNILLLLQKFDTSKKKLLRNINFKIAHIRYIHMYTNAKLGHYSDRHVTTLYHIHANSPSISS